jgi:nitrite reductase (NO-forming)
VLAHAIALGARIGRALTGPLAATVWFYVAASAALLASMGLGVLLAGGASGSADAYRAMRLAHARLNVFGWVGLAVVGTQFTLWPTVLRTRMVPGVDRAVRWSLATMVMGLAAATAGLLGQARVVALAGLAGYAAGLAAALGPFLRTMLGRRPHTAASWMLGAGLGLAGLLGRWSIWSHWPAAHRSSISTSGSTGWFRPSWLALPCRC